MFVFYENACIYAFVAKYTRTSYKSDIFLGNTKYFKEQVPVLTQTFAFCLRIKCCFVVVVFTIWIT